MKNPPTYTAYVMAGLTLLALAVCLLIKNFDPYANALVGAFYEMTFLPLMGILFLTPVFSLYFFFAGTRRRIAYLFTALFALAVSAFIVFS